MNPEPDPAHIATKPSKRKRSPWRAQVSGSIGLLTITIMILLAFFGFVFTTVDKQGDRVDALLEREVNLEERLAAVMAELQAAKAEANQYSSRHFSELCYALHGDFEPVQNRCILKDARSIRYDQVFLIAPNP
jgi:hypothetical protein